jgi:hypothetical protein
MTNKIPIRTVFDAANNATGLAEFQNDETVGYAHGGTGLSVLGTTGQILQVNSSRNGFEFGDKADTTTFATKDTRITLSGDVSGSANLSTNAVSISVDISSTGTTTGSFGSSSQVPVLTVAADGRITNISNTAVAGVDSVSYNTANSLLTINTSDGGSRTTNITLQPFDTDDLSEGSTNQFFTTARARASITAGSGINISSGVISTSTIIDYGLIDGAVGANTEDYGSIA